MQPSSHRLPTVSASQTLSGLADGPTKYVRSGLPTLDTLLAAGSRKDDASIGGFERGKVTEIWGPIGSGKTALALQAAANDVENDSTVIWVDATKPLNIRRLEAVFTGTARASEALNHIHQFSVPTLSHLLALLLQPPPEFITSKTSLLVLTGVNALVDLDYPRYQTTTPHRTEQQKWQSGRRYAILGSLVTALNRIAVLNSLAVVVTTGCSMRSRSDSGLGSAVVPGVGGQEWDAGIWNRLLVFRDFAGRYIGVQKRSGKSLISREEVGEMGKVVSCEIDAYGILRERQVKVSDETHAAPPPKLKTSSAPKRAYDEINDSEDEDADEYGWIDTDEHALAMESLIEDAQQVEKDNGSP